MRFRIKHLTEQEIYVLENAPTRTYKSIAKDLGVYPERVRQIFNKAERKVKAGLDRSGHALLHFHG